MENVLDMGFNKFEDMQQLRLSLAYAIASGLNQKGDEILLCDFSFGGINYTGNQILINALALSEKLKNLNSQSGRIGIAIPPSYLGILANYACVFAGLRPINLNFTLGEVAARSCLETGKIDIIITSEIFKEKITKANPRFPWTEKTFDIADFQNEIKPLRLSQISELATENFEKLCLEFDIKKYAPNDKEATLVFTSGSEGNPKAAILTERNLIANCLQTKLSHLFKADDVFMANLPIFHSFGLLFEVWYMAIFGQMTVTLFNPLDIKSNIRAIREKRVTIMVGSPTFYRPYLKHATPEDMSSLRVAVSGAEKTPHGFKELWDSRFGDSYREGYGLTEASPVVGVNLPERDFGYYSTGNRKGAIGKLFTGMQAKILDINTRKVLPFGEQGLLAMRGANIFKGYLNNPQATQAAFSGDWLVTGDLSRIDGDGFLFIDGRLSRFSKIGAEMVPHATVEAALIKELGFADCDVPMLAISSRLDESKGEALVLLSAADISLADAKAALRNAGLSNLWHPKHLVRVEKIPLLSTGKLDLLSISKIAAQTNV